MAFSITDLRAYVRVYGRNANDPAAYPDASIDSALMQAIAEWQRLTPNYRKLDQVTLTVGTTVVPAFPAGFVPSLLVRAFLTLSGVTLDPGISFTTIDAVLRRQATLCQSSNTPNSPPSGKPQYIGFQDQTNPQSDFAADKPYVVNVWWRPQQAFWTPGSDTPPFVLPDDALFPIASQGAVSYLHAGEPDNAALSKQMHDRFLESARQFNARDAGGTGEQELIMRPAIDSSGDWVR